MEYMMNRNIESRTEGLRHSHANVSACQVPAVIAAFVLAVILIAVVNPPLSFAEEAPPAAVVSYRDGKITGVYETTIQIDHKTFSFAPEVVILDRHNDPLSERDIRVDLEVKYHLLKGTTDKIDQMIVFLPE
ncbi:MAG: hypothetical protein BVN28_03030 [Nitrospira sp. ST-bin4]|nr:MAG: hypothetical protein BVN28_03030 [Nitrospira sp. ST-bin4]